MADSDSLTLYTTARPTPVNGVDDGRRQDYTASTMRTDDSNGDYIRARDALYEQIPKGWQMLGISQWPINPAAAEG